MKKVTLIFLSLVLALSTVAAFAYGGSPDFTEAATFDEAEAFEADGTTSRLVGKSVNDGTIDSSINRLRMEWTASRGFPQENATFVDLDGNVCIKLVNNEYITADYQLTDLAYATIDLKVVNPGKFCGMLIDADGADFYGQSGFADTTVIDAVNERYVLETGYGFTIIDKNTIRAFINNIAGKPVSYADFELGFDASADFHSYAMYKDTDELKAYLAVDDKYIAVFDFSAPGEKLGIYNANGTAKAVNAPDAFDTTGTVIVAVSGECEVYLDNLDLAGYDELPAAAEQKEEKPADATEAPAEATEAPADATEAPADATEAPADATEAPADETKAPADATEAPADETKAPADETKAPADATKEPEKKGCGSVVSGAAVVLAAACALVIRKKD